MKKCINVALAEAEEKLGASWKPSPNVKTLTGTLAEAERELCRRDPNFVPSMITRPVPVKPVPQRMTEAQLAELHTLAVAIRAKHAAAAKPASTATIADGIRTERMADGSLDIRRV
jgi:hypothetical protein